MSPQRMFQIAQSFEQRFYPELYATGCPARRAYLADRLNHACFIKTCATIRMKGGDAPKMVKRTFG